MTAAVEVRVPTRMDAREWRGARGPRSTGRCPGGLTRVRGTGESVLPRREVRIVVTVVTVERIVQRPPGVVFDFVARHHFENHSRWDRYVLEMSQTSPGPVDVGTTARIVRRQGRGRVEGTATVVEYEPDRRAAWDVRFGAFRLSQRAECVPEQRGAATRLRLSIDTSAHGAVRMIMPLLRGRFRKTMTQSLRTIAALLEHERS
jgi:hypothetical protein